MAEKTVLIVEDDGSIQRVLKRTLQSSYSIQTAADLESAEKALSQMAFDLILLDINIPGGSGLDLCEKIKSNVYMRQSSVILVSGLASIEDKINGLRLGADDYITKPFSSEELLARADAAVRKGQINLEANPLTKLPGNGSIEREIYRQIRSQKVFAVLYIDINNFKPYNDYCGFLRGDGVIQRTGELLVEQIVTPEELVGHIGGDDFIFVTNRDDVEMLCKNILKRFDETVPSFYDKEDLDKGFIVTKDRQDNLKSFPLLSLSIGVATNKKRPLTSVGLVSTTGTELKNFAKKQGGSSFAIEKRSDPYPSPQKLSTPPKT